MNKPMGRSQSRWFGDGYKEGYRAAMEEVVAYANRYGMEEAMEWAASLTEKEEESK